ncbi:uncharacterized protein LOC116051433 [Sander lucioperca]|uniref:uncharacterized protein LOC116051433 n=1 Tax=Sander lucioperca TaxID=283035 RepID=UPI00125DAC79|nr:uncharacterized protein LOC116051433 [Sander lucioperca]
MMKTLCVAVVVLGLTSVCQPAPLVCEKLQKRVEKSPDLSGRWHCIAFSTEFCVATTIMNAIYWPSVAVDFISKDTPNIYTVNTKFKMYGYCRNESTSDRQSGYKNNTVFDVDSNDAPTSKPMVLLQSGCPDCIVLKEDVNAVNAVMLFSRRQNVSAAELKEFAIQAECLGLTNPQVLNTDHDYQNCLREDDISNAYMNEVMLKGLERLKTKVLDIMKCIPPQFRF